MWNREHKPTVTVKTKRAITTANWAELQYHSFVMPISKHLAADVFDIFKQY